METLKATVNKIIYHKEDSGYKVLSTRLLSGKTLIIIGEFGPEIIPESIADFHGEYKTHPKYGFQFKAKAYSIVHNAEELSSIRLYLDNIAPSIGPERSGAIVNHFKKDTIKILDESPEKLLEVPGIGEVSYNSLMVAWKDNRARWDAERVIYSLRSFLNSIGLKERRIKKVLSYFGGHEFDAEDKIKTNPYQLIEIEGFGFSTVDFIARRLGTTEDSPDRFKAFIVYCIEIMCPSAGHLFLTIPEILITINEFCVSNNTRFLDKEIILSDIEKALKDLSNKLIIDEDKIYSKSNFKYESESASLLNQIMNTKSDLLFLTKETVEKYIERFEHENNIQLSDEQRTALFYFAEKKVFVLTGPPGTGKCLGYNTPVIMFDGSIKMVQNIKAGELLMGDDSTPRTVLSTCSGKDNLYKITPVKGDPFIINEPHILSLKANSNMELEKGAIIDIALPDYFNLAKHKKHHLKLFRVPITFPLQKISLDPYLLGYWLGNGCSDSTSISTPFSEVVGHLSKIVIPHGLSIKKYPGDNVDYGITCDRNSSYYKTLNDKRSPNMFLDKLREYDLINNKHIPDAFKYNNEETRLKVLAGILDSDGYYDRSGTYELTLKSEKLMGDVTYLCRSLGFSIYPKPVKKKWDCIVKGKHYQGEGTYLRASISGVGLERIPCIIQKKKAHPRKQKKDNLVTGFKVDPLGKGNYYGFELDGNGRFLLGDFTVTHNTRTLQAIVQLALTMGLRLTCITPTGISAKKLATTINFEAYTVHRRLGFRGKEWVYNENNQFDTDVIVVDEVSMLDQEVFYRLLSALKKRTHIIFVGDHNQLPAVSAGNVLRELIHCGHVPVVTLDKIFRQDEASDIIKAAHQIIHGDTTLSLFKSEPTSDIFFMRIKEVQEIEKIVVALATKFKNEKIDGKPRLFQVITPRNTGPLGVDSLNQILQEALNPPSVLLNEMKLINFTIRRGDRVIVRKNDYENEIFNGDIGKVVSIVPSCVTIKIDERLVDIPTEEVEEKIRLAYSLTVHRIQGQECPTIILLMINQHGKNLLQRNLLYTAITRARQKVIVIGHGSAVERAINNTSVIKRNTKLGERLCLPSMKKVSLSTQLSEQVLYPDAIEKEEPFLSEVDKSYPTDIIETS